VASDGFQMLFLVFFVGFDIFYFSFNHFCSFFVIVRYLFAIFALNDCYVSFGFNV